MYGMVQGTDGYNTDSLCFFVCCSPVTIPGWFGIRASRRRLYGRVRGIDGWVLCCLCVLLSGNDPGWFSGVFLLCRNCRRAVMKWNYPGHLVEKWVPGFGRAV